MKYLHRGPQRVPGREDPRRIETAEPVGLQFRQVRGDPGGRLVVLVFAGARRQEECFAVGVVIGEE